jgi:2-oxo-3-hexenedioate decarboxylase
MTVLHPAHALDLGEPMTVEDGATVEPSIAFVLGSDLDSPYVTTTEVLGATAAVCPALSVGGRYLLGNPVPVVGVDLRLVGVVLERNGDVVATAAGAACGGHPAAAVARFARSFGEDALRAGQVVLAGALTEPLPVAAGDVVVLSVGRLGSVQLACR